MKRPALRVAAAAMIGVLWMGCDQSVEESARNPVRDQATESSDPFAPAEGEVIADEPVPKTLDEALDFMMKGLSYEDRKLIEGAGDDYATDVHLGSGMGMRNSWGLWGDSPLTRYFARLGIYHADDMSAIINEAFSRKVRGKDIQLAKLVQFYRDYWEKEDIIAPLDLSCPHCKKEMRIDYRGDGISEEFPQRKYFSGNCSSGRTFYYYHKDGWKPENEVTVPELPPAERESRFRTSAAGTWVSPDRIENATISEEGTCDLTILWQDHMKMSKEGVRMSYSLERDCYSGKFSHDGEDYSCLISVNGRTLPQELHVLVQRRNSFLARNTRLTKGEQAGAGQPATRPESKSEGSAKPQPESEGRAR